MNPLTRFEFHGGPVDGQVSLHRVPEKDPVPFVEFAERLGEPRVRYAFQFALTLPSGLRVWRYRFAGPAPEQTGKGRA
jgi:hypothetical protein